MTIEQEFFEAFGIRKIRRCELDDECFMGFGHSCEECDIYGQAYEVYPPITSKTVLNLIKILLDCDIDILMAKDENGYIARKNIMSYSMNWVVDENFNNTVLKLCIQLQPNIQDQVKALFNA